jgi:hypothetical protein
MHYLFILFAQTVLFLWKWLITMAEEVKICVSSKNPKDQPSCTLTIKNYLLFCRNLLISGVNSYTNTNILSQRHSQTLFGACSAASILATADENPKIPLSKDTKTQLSGQSSATTPARKA